MVVVMMFCCFVMMETCHASAELSLYLMEAIRARGADEHAPPWLAR